MMRVIVFFSLFLFITGRRLPHNNGLHEAAQNGRLDEVRRFVEEENYDVNKKGFNGATPLIYAAKNGSIETVKYLVEKGANVNDMTRDKFTPLMFAISTKNSSNLAVVKYLVENGANVSLANNHNVTALHKAAINDKFEIVKYLLEKGANIDVLDYYKITPLMDAVYANSSVTAKYLVDNGAKVETEKSYLLLRYSILNKNVEMLKYFVGLGVPVNITDDEGKTPLHHAVIYFEENMELIKFLVEKGADVNTADYEKRTPVHYAAKDGFKNVLQYFIENANANMLAKDNEKNTPLNLAQKFRNVEAIEYLESISKKDVKT